ncbi:MAG: hypothetical protein WBP81_03275 [Solirubrobacteraceae bacterium]
MPAFIEDKGLSLARRILPHGTNGAELNGATLCLGPCSMTDYYL